MIRAFLILLLSCVTLRAATTFYYCPTTNDLISIYIVPTQHTRLEAWLSGLSTTNTTAGGLFVYNTNSAVAVDWLNYFKPANQNGRWERQLGIIPPARTITAGTGLTGGGDLSANRTIALANTAVTPDSYGSASQSAVIDVDQQGRITGIADATINIPASQVNSGATLTAGSGLTGTTAAALLTAGTLNIGAGTGITVNADDVALSAGTQTSLGLANAAVQPSRQIISGGGLTGGGDLSADRTLAVGAGTGITVNANDIAIADTAVTPDAYGSANQSAVIAIDQQGRITSASDINIELDAVRIITGTIAPARLGSGSGGSTKFLREDSTFQTIAGATPANLSVGTGVSIAAGTGTGATLQAVTLAIDQTFTPTWTGLHIWKAGTRISTDATYETVPEASLQGWFKYNAAGTQRQFGQITFAKENDIDGNDAGSFAIATRANGGSVVNKVTVSSAGVVNIDQMTANRYMKSSSGKDVSTTATETANTVFAGPTSGGAAVPAFRALVAADLSGIAPTATSAEVIGTTSDYTFSGSGAMEEVDFGGGDPTLSLPSAGTYFIYATIDYNAAVGGTTGFLAQMKNTTDSTFVGVAVATVYGSATLNCITTIAGAKTLKLFAQCSSTVGTPKVVALQTLVGYVKLN